MEDKTWIKLYRKIRDNPIYSNSTALHIWIELLLRAGFKTRTKYLKRKKITLLPGQCVMGHEEMSDIVGCSVGTTYYWISEMISERLIESNPTPKGTIITIKNWCRYQTPESIPENKLKTDRKQIEPNNKDKKVNNVKKKYIKKKVKPSIDDTRNLEYLEGLKKKFNVNDEYLVDQYEKWEDYLKSTGRTYRDYQATFRRWIRTSLEGKYKF